MAPHRDTIPLSLIGTTLSHFKITAKLGAGGMGEVYRAEDTDLGREVALKILPEDLVQNPDRVRRFVQEAKAASALSHPYIVTIHEIGEENDVHYIAMELVDGGSLKDKIHKEGASLKQILGWLGQAAEGLAKAHSAGIIHRDLKPDNIMITRDGFAKVLDFGLAKLTEPLGGHDSQVRTGLADETAAGAVLGTVGYMSPEQVQGMSLDPRSDVFSFGCILYEATTRQRPFTGETAVDTMHQILRGEPAPVRELNPETPSVLRRLIRRTLAKDPEHRFQSMRDLAFELADLAEDYDQLSVSGESQTLSSGAGLKPITEPAGRSGLLKLVAGAVVLGALALIGYLALRGGGETSPVSAPALSSFTQLTFEAGSESHPALSPDGNFVVYSGDTGGKSDLFLLRIGGSRAINLTQTPQVAEWAPAFSPDGQSIAFTSDRDGTGIFIMGSTGERVRRLSDVGSDPAWSPDGGSIVFASQSFAVPEDRGTYSQLLVVSATGGEPTEIYSDDAVQPSWSPNGERIAFWALRGDGGIRDIASIPAAGGEAVWITDDPALDWNPVWSPDGRWLYFASDRGGSKNLWRVAIDEASGHPLGDPEPMTTPSSALGFFAVAANGRQIAYSNIDEGVSISSRGFDIANLGVSDNESTLIESSLPLTFPDLSPDGKRIVLSAFGSVNDLYIANSDGSDLQRLTNESAKNRGGQWAPDGQSIVFYSDRSGSYQIWRIRADGSGLEQLTESPGALLWPAVSPDGRYLLTSDIATGSLVFDLDKSLPMREPIARPSLDDPDLVFSAAAWSPDSSRILGTIWSEKAQTQMGVGTFSLADARVDIIYRAEPGLSLDNPSWMLDGERIVFFTELETGEGAMMVANRDGSQVQEIWRYPSYNRSRQRFLAQHEVLLTFEFSQSSDLWLATFE